MDPAGRAREIRAGLRAGGSAPGEGPTGDDAATRRSGWGAIRRSPNLPGTAAGPAHRIGLLAGAYRAAGVALLASAFRDNPLNCAVVRGGERRRLRANYHAMSVLLEHAVGPACVMAARESGSPGAGRLAGVLVALPPLVYPLPSPPLFEQLLGVLRQGLGVTRRWARVYRELAAVHPTEPHWYLGVLGVEPSLQGRGVGSALLESWLRRVDADPAPAYLETDREENLVFYRRAGFAPLDSRRVMGVPIWLLWRDGRHHGGRTPGEIRANGPGAGF